MAHHQEKHYEQPHTVRRVPSGSTPRSPSSAPLTIEDELVVDVDEPPDKAICFGRISTPQIKDFQPTEGSLRSPISHFNRPESLLTQALLASSELTPNLPSSNSPTSRATSTASNYSTTSATSTAELSSDGGLTSPARTDTPSPIMPSASHVGPVVTTPQRMLDLDDYMARKKYNGLDTNKKDSIATNNVAEPEIGRKRCIRFACGFDSKESDKDKVDIKEDGVIRSKQTSSKESSKRPCMLRFACPSKPPTESNAKIENSRKESQHTLSSPLSSASLAPPLSKPSNSQHSEMHTLIEPKPNLGNEVAKLQMPTTCFPLRSKYRPEGIRFHEFASQYQEEDEWLHEQPTSRHKITVTDTLRKENAIRKIGEEVEEEALEEENAEEEADLDLDDLSNAEDDDCGPEDSSSNDTSDGGNETDDEEGFAESDDESDVASEYQFWAPATTTAATSIEQNENARSRIKRTVSVSSIESIVNVSTIRYIGSAPHRRRSKKSHSTSSPRMLPGTPDLPDSTDFVCGTLDEDRPLEAAYISCLRQRRITKNPPIPQDFDPSFPTSDLDEEDKYKNAVAEASDEQEWVTGRPDDSEGDQERGRMEGISKKHSLITASSPKRLRSPPIPKSTGRKRSPPPPSQKHRPNYRSPPPKPFFGGHSPKRFRSPLPHARNVQSPTSSRSPPLLKPSQENAFGIQMLHLAERSNLPHTKSLPRTPNPFWRDHHNSRREDFQGAGAKKSSGHLTNGSGEANSRGPIDIVQGLENKRQRRKEKFWRQHCRHAGKEKERRCQPGKGAQMMRELGLEMAGKTKAYGHRTQFMLSV